MIYTPNTNESIFDTANRLKLLLRIHATNGKSDNSEYQELRSKLVQIKSINKLIPAFVRSCRTLDEFWDLIKETDTGRPDLGIWAGRRVYLKNQFEPLLSHLESNDVQSFDVVDVATVEIWGTEQILATWDKAKNRCDDDPEGAITAGKSMLESVLKHILHEAGEEPSSTDLLRLYRQTVIHLNLAPDQHAEQFFKQILSGCHSVVNGLASVRNQYSDSHGAGPKYVRPASRHARFVVSLSGVLSNYLIETWHHVQSVQSDNSVPVFQKVSP